MPLQSVFKPPMLLLPKALLQTPSSSCRMSSPFRRLFWHSCSLLVALAFSEVSGECAEPGGFYFPQLKYPSPASSTGSHSQSFFHIQGAGSGKYANKFSSTKVFPIDASLTPYGSKKRQLFWFGCYYF